MVTATPTTTPAKPVIASNSGGGFLDDLLSTGGTLFREASTTAMQIYMAKQKAKLAAAQEATSQPEVQRLAEPAKGQNQNGQTVVAPGTEAATTDKILFAGITQKQALIGGGVLLAVGAAAFFVGRG